MRRGKLRSNDKKSAKKYAKNLEVPIFCVPLHPRSRKTHKSEQIGAVVQLVRIPACHAGGRGFESRPHRQREHSSVGLEHLPYKQRVGGSTPSAPTKENAFLRCREAFFISPSGSGQGASEAYCVSASYHKSPASSDAGDFL